MAYTTKTELENAIGASPLLKLCDDDLTGSWDTAATANLNHCITQAGRIIDGYAQSQFEVPFEAPTPPMIAEFAVALAGFYLYRRRRAAFAMPEDVKEEREETLKQLVKLNEGKLDPGVQPQPAASSKIVGTYDGPAQAFTGGTDGTLKDFS